MHRPPRKGPDGANFSSDPDEREFRRDWGAIKKQFTWFTNRRRVVRGGEDNDDDSELFAASAVQCDFFRKHRRRLERKGINVDEMLSKTVARTEEFRAAVLVEQEAIEQHLQSSANLAEARANLTVALFKVLQHWEGMSAGDWEGLDPLQRAEQWELMTNLRADMPALLAALPLERRRELEEGQGGAPGAA